MNLFFFLGCFVVRSFIAAAVVSAVHVMPEGERERGRRHTGGRGGAGCRASGVAMREEDDGRALG